MDKQQSAKQIAAVFEEIATLLELKGENPFKSRAYSNAAGIIRGLEGELNVLVERGELSEIPGIGAALSKKISEFVKTGKLKYFDDLKATVPAGHLQMLAIRGLGPKKIRRIHQSLGIDTVDELEKACNENRLPGIRGFGKKIQENILKGIELLRVRGGFRLYSEAIGEADSLLAYLEAYGRGSYSLAGPLRRGCELIRDIDIVASNKHPDVLAEHLFSFPKRLKILDKDRNRFKMILDSGVQVNLKAVGENTFPFALLSATGSPEHYESLVNRALSLGMTLDGQGLSTSAGPVPCRDEKEIFSALGLPFIAPELREARGEIEAAALGRLPHPVEMKDIKGILHVHTKYSDGTDTIETLADAARFLGYRYIGISDHSRSAFYAGGLSIEDISRQHEEIDILNGRGSDIHIFKGIEVEILPDGSMDYDDKVLERFDFIIAAVHSHFNMAEPDMTGRIVRALEHPLVTMLAHPSGRLLLSREPYAVDLDRVIDAAAAHGKVIELNANPYRLDLDWRFCRKAKEKGVKISINPDAHHWTGFYDLRYGVNQARKGWLEASDCLNTLPPDEIRSFFYSRKTIYRRSS